jgi:tol-pal system protein YbgF
VGVAAVVATLAGVPLVAVGQQSPQMPAAGEVTLSRQSAMELLSQLDALQTEVRQLRNQVELQGSELERLTTRQRNLLEDMDQRLSALERGAVRTATAPMQRTPPPAAPAHTPTPSQPQPPPSTAMVPAPATAPTATASAPPLVRTTASAQEQREYDAAFNLLKQGLYARASQAFAVFTQKYPTSPLAGNAQYWTAEANYVVRNFGPALDGFHKVINNYPQSAKVADASLKIGYSYYELRNWDKARVALTGVVDRFPNTTVARLAQIRLDKMKEEGH